MLRHTFLALTAERATLIAGFADISLAQLALIAGTALLTSLIGGVAGYGTGALMPLVLVPIVGPEPVVPIISLSALFTNTGRAVAFRHLVDWRKALIVLAAAVPTCALGAWGYTLLTGKGALIVIGGMLIAERAAAPADAPPRALAVATAASASRRSPGDRSPAAPSAPASSCSRS